jgi:hypothetical protein
VRRIKKIIIFFVIVTLLFSGIFSQVSAVNLEKNSTESIENKLSNKDGWFDSVEVGKIEMDFISSPYQDQSFVRVTGSSVEVTPRTLIKIPITWTAKNKRTLSEIIIDFDAKVKLFKANWHQDLNLEPGESASGDAYLSFRAPKNNGEYEYTIWAECDYDAEDSAPLKVTVKGDSVGKEKSFGEENIFEFFLHLRIFNLANFFLKDLFF